MFVLQHDQSRTEVNNLRGQNFDLKSKIEMLEVQVRTSIILLYCTENACSHLLAKLVSRVPLKCML